MAGRARSALHRLLQLEGRCSFAEARTAYRQRALEIHPDRFRDHAEKAAAHPRFSELQSTWEAFKLEEKRRPRPLDGGQSGEAAEAYTGVGVGCSWTDDANEQAFRQNVMEMASRGVMFPPELEALHDAHEEEEYMLGDEEDWGVDYEDGLLAMPWATRPEVRTAPRWDPTCRDAELEHMVLTARERREEEMARRRGDGSID